eukprot:Em0001g1419a
MDQLTRDLEGVAVYMDDILGIAKGSKIDAVKMMPPPETVSGLPSFLGSVQFYGKFLPNLASVTEPLHHLTKKDVPWKWGIEEQQLFRSSKTCCTDDTILVHFDFSLPIGISCDASEVGLGAILIHQYSGCSEHPIANASKTLTSTQHGCIQVARWALSITTQLNIGRRQTMHGNADALSRLPAGPDANFDGLEGTLAKESAKDTVIANVMRYTREGWPPKDMHQMKTCKMVQWKFFAIYWPGMDAEIMDLCHRCTAYAKHQNKPPKVANHPWMLPEKRVHVDRAINCLGSNWLVLTTSTSTKSLLDQDFAYFGYPHTIVLDNTTSFSSEEFQTWYREKGNISGWHCRYYTAVICGSFCKLVHLARTTPPSISADSLQSFDEEHALSRKLDSHLFHSILMASSPANKARLLSSSAAHASSWLSVVPSVGLGLHLDSSEFHTAVIWWLGMNFTARSSCPFCPDIALDPLGHHAVSCRHGGDVVIRHNRLRNIIADFCRRAHLSVRIEVGRGLLGTHNYTRPADVLVDGWDRAKPAAFDVTVTSPLTPVTLNEASINEGAAALAAETRKHAANDARCQALGWSCIPLAVETFGNWGREAQGVFSRLATLLALHQGRSKSTVVRDIYGHLSISLVRSVARSIMGREIVH